MRGTAGQLRTGMADGDRSEPMACLVTPTRVIHGCDEALVSDARGEDQVRRIADSLLNVASRMGRDLPDALFERFANAIRDSARRAEGA